MPKTQADRCSGINTPEPKVDKHQVSTWSNPSQTSPLPPALILLLPTPVGRHRRCTQTKSRQRNQIKFSCVLVNVFSYWGDIKAFFFVSCYSTMILIMVTVHTVVGLGGKPEYSHLPGFSRNHSLLQWGTSKQTLQANGASSTQAPVKYNVISSYYVKLAKHLLTTGCSKFHLVSCFKRNYRGEQKAWLVLGCPGGATVWRA